jgi:hypothetical protein
LRFETSYIGYLVEGMELGLRFETSYMLLHSLRTRKWNSQPGPGSWRELWVVRKRRWQCPSWWRWPAHSTHWTNRRGRHIFCSTRLARGKQCRRGRRRMATSWKVEQTRRIHHTFVSGLGEVVRKERPVTYLCAGRAHERTRNVIPTDPANASVMRLEHRDILRFHWSWENTLRSRGYTYLRKQVFIGHGSSTRRTLTLFN